MYTIDRPKTAAHWIEEHDRFLDVVDEMGRRFVGPDETQAGVDRFLGSPPPTAMIHVPEPELVRWLFWDWFLFDHRSEKDARPLFEKVGLPAATSTVTRAIVEARCSAPLRFFRVETVGDDGQLALTDALTTRAHVGHDPRRGHEQVLESSYVLGRLVDHGRYRFLIDVAPVRAEDFDHVVELLAEHRAIEGAHLRADRVPSAWLWHCSALEYLERPPTEG
ncbi:MAG: hypothetical protein R3F20_18960 [Planctomycetota bacterium]